MVAVPKTAVACAWISAKRDGRSKGSFLLIASAAMNELVACLSTEELQTLTHLLTKVLLHAGCPRASLQES